MTQEGCLVLRDFKDADIELFRKWLSADHVKRWYEHPEEWMDEIEKRHTEYAWIHHFIAELDGAPIGFMQFYEYCKGGETWHGNTNTEGAYSIDYLIGEPNQIGRGLGRKMICGLLLEIDSLPDAKLVIVQPDKQNKASCAALLSAGFHYDEMNKLYRYELRKERK